MVAPTPGSDYDATYTSSPCVIRDGDHWKLYYMSRINQKWKSHAIGLATNRGQLIE